MTLVVLNWVGLLLSTLLGIALGLTLSRYLARNELPEDNTYSATGFLTDALAYVSGVLGIMLGLLLFFSVEVYEDASSSARDGALALVNVYESADYFPQAKARIIPDAGHWLHAEKPLLFNRLVVDFLSTSR